MKKTLLITIILLLPFVLIAQTKPPDVPDLNKIEIPEDSTALRSQNVKPDILSNALITEDSNNRAGDREPEFPGGVSSFYNYLIINIRKIPSINHVKGEVTTQFVINSDGHVIEPKILGGAMPEDIKQQILKVLIDSPTWSPPIQNYRRVRVRYTMPLSF